MSRRTPWLILAASGVLWLGVATGCMGTQFGAELSAKPKPRALRATQPTTLRLPQDEAFVIALPSASKKPGLDGTAEADASARTTGQAEASAGVKQSGTAEALFQLGHALANETDRQMDLDCTVRLKYEFDVSNTPAQRLADATIGLRLYVREARGRLLRDLALLDYTTESGAAGRTGDESFRFTATLAPGDVVHVFLAGLAKVDIPGERAATAKLKVSGFQFDIIAQPAPAVQPATRPVEPRP